MTSVNIESQIPHSGKLAVLRDDAATGERHYLAYGGGLHLRLAYKIPIELLHFNIENGRYVTKFQLLQSAYRNVNIDPEQRRWRDEMLKLFDGTWKDPQTGVDTSSEKLNFERLKNDIQNNTQEKPGVVIETGAVMSGNRRLAVLITLHKQYPEAEQYKYFKAFIVPSGDRAMSASDRWRLEISQQQGATRLQSDYGAIERLLKIREGINLFRQSESEDQAIKIVSSDFGTDAKNIQADMKSLMHVDSYLDTIGHPGEYWRVQEKTEVFLEYEAVAQAMDRNNFALPRKGKIKAAVFELAKRNVATNNLVRDIRKAVGQRAGTTSDDSLKVLESFAPSSDALKVDGNSPVAERKARDVATDFKTELEASDTERDPIKKARTAETNLLKVKTALGPGGISGVRSTNTGEDANLALKEALENSRQYASDALQLLAEQFEAEPPQTNP